jgi:hypothetical protein
VPAKVTSGFCVCVCVCVCVRVRMRVCVCERARVRERERDHWLHYEPADTCSFSRNRNFIWNVIFVVDKFSKKHFSCLEVDTF